MLEGPQEWHKYCKILSIEYNNTIVKDPLNTIAEVKFCRSKVVYK